MKFITTIIAGVIVGAIGVYFTLDWQEEKLEFSITAPAKFGEVNYQNITLANKGWNPAVNIKLYIDHSGISFSNVQSSASLKDLSEEKNGISSIERIRRDESLIFSIAYKGQPLFGNEVKIASDRSIALQIENEIQYNVPLWMQVSLGLFSFFFVVGLLSSIAIPQYQKYVKRVEEATKLRELPK